MSIDASLHKPISDRGILSIILIYSTGSTSKPNYHPISYPALVATIFLAMDYSIAPNSTEVCVHLHHSLV